MPWGRVWALAQLSPWPVLAMVTLTAAGSVAGLGVPLGIGALADDVARHAGSQTMAGHAGVVVAAIATAFAAYTASDVLYARIAAGVVAHLRLSVAEAVARRPGLDAEGVSGVQARLLSDAETVEELSVALFDLAASSAVSLAAAAVALVALSPPAALALTVVTLAALPVMRRAQRPASIASERRQEAIEEMSRALPAALLRGSTAGRFAAAVAGVRRCEIRLGWVEAASRHGAGALASLTPVAAVVAASLAGAHRAGVLVSVYLVAGRVSGAVDDLVDAALDIQLARGPLHRVLATLDGAVTR